MKIVHLIKATRIGGAERHLLILLKALRERGVDAHLLLLVEGDNFMDHLVTEAKERGIPVQRIVIHGHLDIPVINRIRSRLLQLKPDVLHTHLVHADVYGLAAARLAGVQTVISSRHNDDPFRAKYPMRYLSRWQWNRVRGGIAISHAIKRFAVDVEYAPPEKMRVIHYGIEHQRVNPQAISRARKALLQEFSLPDDALLIGMACRLVEQKGVRYALQAMSFLQSNFPQARLLIAGDGDLRESLQQKAQSLGVRDRVRFLGWRDDIPAFMAGLDIFLMPSLWEGFGLVAIEAMSKRVPVVASDVSALPEVITHEETGFLVPPRHPHLLAESLSTLLGDRALRAHMGMLAEDRVETYFTVERMAQQTIDAYHAWL